MYLVLGETIQFAPNTELRTSRRFIVANGFRQVNHTIEYIQGLDVWMIAVHDGLQERFWEG